VTGAEAPSPASSPAIPYPDRQRDRSGETRCDAPVKPSRARATSVSSNRRIGSLGQPEPGDRQRPWTSTVRRSLPWNQAGRMVSMIIWVTAWHLHASRRRRADHRRRARPTLATNAGLSGSAQRGGQAARYHEETDSSSPTSAPGARASGSPASWPCGEPGRSVVDRLVEAFESGVGLHDDLRPRPRTTWANARSDGEGAAGPVVSRPSTASATREWVRWC
jgi:hypothetical protein